MLYIPHLLDEFQIIVIQCGAAVAKAMLKPYKHFKTEVLES